MTHDDYMAACRSALSGSQLLAAEELWALLAEREAWTPEVAGTDLVWCFGLLGACTIAITVRPVGFLVYVHADDAETFVDDIAGVARWLEENEPEPGLTALQQEILDDLAPHHIDRWRAGLDGDEGLR